MPFSSILWFALSLQLQSSDGDQTATQRLDDQHLLWLQQKSMHSTHTAQYSLGYLGHNWYLILPFPASNGN